MFLDQVQRAPALPPGTRATRLRTARARRRLLGVMLKKVFIGMSSICREFSSAGPAGRRKNTVVRASAKSLITLIAPLWPDRSGFSLIIRFGRPWRIRPKYGTSRHTNGVVSARGHHHFRARRCLGAT